MSENKDKLISSCVELCQKGDIDVKASCIEWIILL